MGIEKGTRRPLNEGDLKLRTASALTGGLLPLRIPATLPAKRPGPDLVTAAYLPERTGAMSGCPRGRYLTGLALAVEAAKVTACFSAAP